MVEPDLKKRASAKSEALFLFLKYEFNNIIGRAADDLT